MYIWTPVVHQVLKYAPKLTLLDKHTLLSIFIFLWRENSKSINVEYFITDFNISNYYPILKSVGNVYLPRVVK